jgi:hypothetical protein
LEAAQLGVVVERRLHKDDVKERVGSLGDGTNRFRIDRTDRVRSLRAGDDDVAARGRIVRIEGLSS